MGNISNVSMGAATLSWGGVDLGHTWGGATVTIDRKFVDLNVDQYGDTPVDKVLTGNELKVEITLAEPVVHKIAQAAPESLDIIGTLGEKLPIGYDAGRNLRPFAKQLVLHPLDNVPTDLTDDVVIYLAVSGDPIALNYQFDKQRLFKVTFYGLVDETKANGYRLGQIGQAAIS